MEEEQGEAREKVGEAGCDVEEDEEEEEGGGELSNSEYIFQYWKHSIIFLSPEICQSIKYGATSLKVVRQIRANIYTWVNITCKGMDRLSSG